MGPGGLLGRCGWLVPLLWGWVPLEAIFGVFLSLDDLLWGVWEEEVVLKL